MSMYSPFKTDAAKEAEGVVVDFGEFRATVRRAGGGNKAYQKTMEALVAPYRRILQLGQMQEGKMKELLAEAYSIAIISKWEYKVTDAGDGLSAPVETWKEGIELVDGSIGPATPENIKAVLIAVPEVMDAIKDIADTSRNFKTEDDEAAKGN